MISKSIRNVFNNLHLWLGLASGLILFVVCLSGTIYTFRAEVERWAEPGKYYADGNIGKGINADSLVAQAAIVEKGTVTGLIVPSDEKLNWQVIVKKEVGKKEVAKAGGKEARPKTFFINPYNGKFEGEQGGSTSEFFTKVMQLHRWLLMEDYGGKIIVGAATLIFVFMVLSGLILWFPSKLRLIKQGLTIRTSANWKRINHDLHNTLGFYSFLVLLIMSLTGLCWSFEWYKDGVSNVLGAKVFRGRSEKPVMSNTFSANAEKASLHNIINNSQQLFNYAGTLRISIPDNDTAAITATKNATGFFASAGADKAHFDRYSGETLKLERFADKPFNVQIADSIRPLHTGEMFGTSSKILYFIVCLVATSLPVTGTFIWLNKMKKNKRPVKVSVIRGEQFA